MIKPIWKPIVSAPKNATNVQVRMKDGTVHAEAHWASNLSGEEQPPFQGWFVPVKGGGGEIRYMRGIDEPVEWKEIAG